MPLCDDERDTIFGSSKIQSSEIDTTAEDSLSKETEAPPRSLLREKRTKQRHRVRPTHCRTHAITIALAIPDDLLSEGLRMILVRAGFKVVVAPKSGHAKVDLVLLRVTDHAHAHALVVGARAAFPSARLVALPAADDGSLLHAALAAGADAVLPSNGSTDFLIKALELVAAGGSVVPMGMARQEIAQARAPATPAIVRPVAILQGCGAGLSSREANVLRGLRAGQSNKQIAREHGLAESTVKVHVKAILRKLRLSNRTQAAIWATQNEAVLGIDPAPPNAAESPAVVEALALATFQ